MTIPTDTELKLKNWFALHLPRIDTSSAEGREMVDEALEILSISLERMKAFHEGRLFLPFYKEVYVPPPRIYVFKRDGVLTWEKRKTPPSKGVIEILYSGYDDEVAARTYQSGNTSGIQLKRKKTSGTKE